MEDYATKMDENAITKKPLEKEINVINKENFQTEMVHLRILYLGWKRSGLTWNDSMNSIEQILFEAVKKARLNVNQDQLHINCVGRTDKTVSGYAQILSMKLFTHPLPEADTNLPGLIYDKSVKEKRFIVKDAQNCSEINDSYTQEKTENVDYATLLNNYLPADVRILAYALGEEFHPRFSCKNRMYKYVFPLGDLNLKSMREASRLLIGHHDFRNFCTMAVDSGIVNFERTISHLSLHCVDEATECRSPADRQWRDAYQMCVANIQSEGFLRHQIRYIIAVLILVGRGKENPSVVRKLLDVYLTKGQPHFGMAQGVGLNLFRASFKTKVEWHVNEENLKKIVQHLHQILLYLSTKRSMVRQILDDVRFSLSRNGSCPDDRRISMNTYRRCDGNNLNIRKNQLLRTYNHCNLTYLVEKHIIDMDLKNKILKKEQSNCATRARRPKVHSSRLITAKRKVRARFLDLRFQEKQKLEWRTRSAL